MEQNEVRERFSQANTARGPDVSGDEVVDAFYALIYENSHFWVVFKDTRLYLAPCADLPSLLCPRAFTHQDIAEGYMREHEEEELSLAPVSAIELIQLTKTALLAGADCLLVNETDVSVVVPLDGLLKKFLTEALGSADMYDERTATLLSFIRKFRFNSSNKLSAVFDDKNLPSWLVEDNTVTVCDSSSSSALPFTNVSNLYPLTPQMLLEAPAETVCVYTDGACAEYKASEVQTALAACGYARPYPPAGSNEYIDYLPNTERLLADWRTPDLSLNLENFSAFEGMSDEPVDSSNSDEPIESKSLVVVPSDPEEEDNKPSKVKKTAERAWKALCGGFARVGESARSTANKAKALISEHHVKKERPPEKEKPEPTEEDENKRKTRHMVIAVASAVLAIILCIAIVLIVQHTRYRRNFIQFCEYLDDRDYGNAYDVYKKNDFYEDGTAYLTKSLDALVLAYARNEISAEELGASITALSQFPGINQEISVAKLTATKLEESKNSYVRGKNSSDVFTRLSNWQQVIDLDEVNYLAVKQNVEENRSAYELVIEEEIEYYSTRNRDFAQRRWQVLQYWYPDSEAVEKWRSEYETDASDILNSYPVTVKEISIKQERNGYWSLRIDWSNISAKTIASIRFSLVALDSKGNIVTSTDSHGSWTIFDARDPGPFEPGQGHDTSTYVWYNAWYGTEIAKVNLTGVYITYKDETTASFSQEVDLLRIQNMK